MILEIKILPQQTFPSDIIALNIPYQHGECVITNVNGWHHK